MISGYTIALFLHIIGAIGFFLDAGIWLFGLATLQRAQRVEQVRSTLTLVARSGPVAGISLVVLLAAGIYMTVNGWGFEQGWIRIAMLSVFLLIVLAAAVIEPRRRALTRLATAAPDGPLSAALAQRAQDSVLSLAVYVQAALLLGIVFLMTTKLAVGASLIAMAVVLVLGLALGWLVSRTRRAETQEAAVRAN
jgi:uncharacterized membrane protein